MAASDYVDGLFTELAHLGECPWEEDWNYAKSVADQLGVELEVW